MTAGEWAAVPAYVARERARNRLAENRSRIVEVQRERAALDESLVELTALVDADERLLRNLGA